MKTTILPCLLPLTIACNGAPKTPVDVDAPSVESVAVTLTLRDPDGVTSSANFVAFRDGAGEWQELTGTAGVYTASVTSGRYGFWVGCVRATGSGRNRLIYRAVGDTTELVTASCTLTTLPLTIGGTLGGLGADDTAEISSLSSTDVPNDATYEVGARAGRAELLASRVGVDSNATSVIRLNLGDISANVVRDIDFTQEGQAPVHVPLTVTNRHAEDLSFDALTGIYSGGGSMYLPFTSVPTDTTTVLALPAAMQLPDDIIDTTISASRPIGDSNLLDRRSTGVFNAAIPSTLALPNSVSFGDATIEIPFSISWTLPALPLAEADVVNSLIFAANSDNKSVILAIDASRSWLAGATVLDVPAPPNLQAALAPATGISWLVDYITGDVKSAWNAAGTSGSQTAKPSRVFDHDHLRILRMERMRP